MVLNAEQHRQRRALQKYARNAAGKLVRTAAFRACDYTEAGLLREFANDDAVLAFELDRYSDGSGYQVKFSSKPKATVPQEQLALQASWEQAVEEDGNQTRLQLTSVEEGLRAHLDDISQRLDALRQPNAAATSALAAPGDLQLMARVQKAFKVARMNAILKECKVERQAGMKMADKAALIVEKVPRRPCRGSACEEEVEDRADCSSEWCILFPHSVFPHCGRLARCRRSAGNDTGCSYLPVTR